MSCVTTTVNVNDPAPAVTAGSFQVRIHFTELDAGFVFGTFSTRERAEQCLLVVAGRSDVKKATIEPGG